MQSVQGKAHEQSGLITEQAPDRCEKATGTEPSTQTLVQTRVIDGTMSAEMEDKRGTTSLSDLIQTSAKSLKAQGISPRDLLSLRSYPSRSQAGPCPRSTPKPSMSLPDSTRLPYLFELSLPLIFSLYHTITIALILPTSTLQSPSATPYHIRPSSIHIARNLRHLQLCNIAHAISAGSPQCLTCALPNGYCC